MKPLGHKAYGSIPHLPGSKRGPGDHGLEERQAEILTGDKGRGNGWEIVVQEKLDGSCMSVAKIGGEIVALGRAGYLASSAPFAHVRLFDPWVAARRDRFDALLDEGERVVGEWMLLATGLRYWIPGGDDLFVAFDVMRGHDRTPSDDVAVRCHRSGVHYAATVNVGPIDPWEAHQLLVEGDQRFHAEGAPEGVVYRAIRHGKVSFLGKWVRPDFEPGRYLGQDVYNFPPQWLGDLSAHDDPAAPSAA